MQNTVSSMFATSLQAAKRWLLPVLLVASTAAPLSAQAQRVAGQVQHLQGMATAQQQPGGSVRFIAKGDTVNEGDVITTTEKGFAIVAFTDGTKVTLRPATTFAIERYAHDQGTEQGLLRLLKGGMRAVSGLIHQRNPGGLEFRTVTATIGIRGTSFDARICGEDCRGEDRAAQSRPVLPAAALAADLVVARLVKATGEVSAQQAGKPVRKLAEGSPIYALDEIRTGADATALLGFRDQSRLAINPLTTVKIDGFSYQSARQPDNFALQLLQGGMRVFTGLIAKSKPQAVTVKTVVATIGIRGTGMDISCEGPCAQGAAASAAANPDAPQASDGLFMRTWLGLTYLDAGPGPVDVPLDTVGFVGAERAPRLLAGVPEFMNQFKATRPDQEAVDWEGLFAVQGYTGEEGLYLYVRDGHVSLQTANGRNDYGVGEAGYIGGDGVPRRIVPIPRFLVDDPFPIPELYVGSDKRVLQLFGATLGQPGQEICRL